MRTTQRTRDVDLRRIHSNAQGYVVKPIAARAVRFADAMRSPGRHRIGAVAESG
jgi:hypothetical protein